MTNWRRYVSLAAGIGLIVAVLVATSTGSALAQGALKPLSALIINTSSQPVPVLDVNGRTPFSHDDVGECNDSNCFFAFPEVPQGKRLVVLHVGGIARPSSTATVFDQAELVTDQTENEFGARNSFAMTLIGKAGSSVVANTYGFNAPVLAFVEAGHAPRISMATSVGGETLFSQATISGYFENVQ